MIFNKMIFLSYVTIAAFVCPGSSAGMLRRKRQGLINILPPRLTRFISPFNPFRAVDLSNENNNELEDVDEYTKVSFRKSSLVIVLQRRPFGSCLSRSFSLLLQLAILQNLTGGRDLY